MSLALKRLRGHNKLSMTWWPTPPQYFPGSNLHWVDLFRIVLLSSRKLRELWWVRFVRWSTISKLSFVTLVLAQSQRSVFISMSITNSPLSFQGKSQYRKRGRRSFHSGPASAHNQTYYLPKHTPCLCVHHLYACRHHADVLAALHRGVKSPLPHSIHWFLPIYVICQVLT